MTFSEAVGKLVWSYKFFLSGIVFGGIAWALLTPVPRPEGYYSAGCILVALSVFCLLVSCWLTFRPLGSKSSQEESNNGKLEYEEPKLYKSSKYTGNRGVDVTGGIGSIFAL